MDNQRQSEKNVLDGSDYAGLFMVLLGAVLVLSLILRVWGIHWGLPHATRFTPLYVDEYTPLHCLSGMDPRHFQFNPHYFTDPTFFYYQVGAFIKAAALFHVTVLTGQQTFYLDHPELYARLYLAGRMAVVVYGVLATGLFYGLGRRVSGSDFGGLFTALLYAITPLAVLSCHVIDVGVPVSFWLGMAFFCFLKALHTHNLKWLYVGALCAGFSLSTKYTSAPIVLPMIYTLWKMRAHRQRILGAPLISLAAFLIGTPYALLAMHEFWAQFHGVAFHMAVGYRPPPSLGFLLSAFRLYPFSTGTPLALLCGMGLVVQLYRRSPAALMAMLFLIPYWTLLGTSTSYITRYANETLPFLLPFAVVPILLCAQRPSFIFKGLAALLTLFAFSSLPFTFALNCTLSHELDPRDQASAWITANLPANTVIGLEREASSDTPGHLYMQYWKGQRYPEDHVRPPAYRIVVWDKKRQAWPDPTMRYWVQNSILHSGLGHKDPEEIAQAQQEGQRMKAGYHPIQRFERRVAWGPFHYSIPALFAGHELFHFFPTITLYEKNR